MKRLTGPPAIATAKREDLQRRVNEAKRRRALHPEPMADMVELAGFVMEANQIRDEGVIEILTRNLPPPDPNERPRTIRVPLVTRKPPRP